MESKSLTKAMWGINVRTVICPYSAFCMGKTVKSKILLLLWATVTMLYLEPQQELYQWSLITMHAHAWKEMGRLQRHLVFRRHRSLEERGVSHVKTLIFGKAESHYLWQFLLSHKHFCKQNSIFPILVSSITSFNFLMQGNTVMKNTSFEGKP